MIKLLDELGYNSYWKILNSKAYGIPQSRNRVFVVSIRKDVDDGKLKNCLYRELEGVVFEIEQEIRY